MEQPRKAATKASFVLEWAGSMCLPFCSVKGVIVYLLYLHYMCGFNHYLLDRNPERFESRIG